MNPTPNAQALNSLPRPEDRPRRHVYESVADLIADPENPTPMVRLSARSRPSPDFDIFVKLERSNPFGSIKDRTALYLMQGTTLSDGQVLTEDFPADHLHHRGIFWAWHQVYVGEKAMGARSKRTPSGRSAAQSSSSGSKFLQWMQP